MRPVLLLSVLALFFASAPAVAQKAAPAPGDMEKRLELSRQMHEIAPTHLQVEKAVEMVGQQLPPQDRDSFKARMIAAIDEKKLETLSVNTMAEIFTAPELERMIAYFSAPEAGSIADKMREYNMRLQPEIIKMIDEAMMAARTGAPPPQ